MGERFAIVAIALMAFGAAYNWLVERLEQRGWDRGYTALLVAFGVAITLAGYAVVAGLEAALTVAGLFVASGTPMLLGSMLRHMRQREADERAARERLLEKLR